MKKIRTAIFGGTFDPFTAAHEAIVEELLAKGGADEVYIAPSVTNWYRAGNDAWMTDEERLIMCFEAATRINRRLGSNAVDVWRDDVNRKRALPEGPLRDAFSANWKFADTLANFKARLDLEEKDVERELYVVIGSDQLRIFKEWRDWKRIIETALLIVVNGRNGETVESDVPHVDISIGAEYETVSATEIRKKYGKMENGLELYKKTLDGRPSETVLYRTPIFDLVRKPATYEDRPDFEPVALKSGDWITVVAEKDGKYMCVRQLRYGLMKEFDEFPCGIVEEAENPIYAARRELEEETGIRVLKGVDPLEYLGKFSPNPAFMNNYMHYFYVDLDKAEHEIVEKKLDENEKLVSFWKDKGKFYEDFVNESGSAMMGLAFALVEKFKKTGR